MWCFDPCVFVDDDGQAYMYFGGAHPDNSRIIKLKENMTEVDGSAVKPNTPGFLRLLLYTNTGVNTIFLMPDIILGNLPI